MKEFIGKTILEYNVDNLIGKGSYAKVYKVSRTNQAGKSERALKVVELPPENDYVNILNAMGGNKKKAVEYFKKELDNVLNEIRLFSYLSSQDNHHIVQYFDNKVEKDKEKGTYEIFIMMEYLEPLSKWTFEHEITVEDGIRIGIDIAKALEVCHKNEVLHRDLKLENIFVDYNERTGETRYKLGDFGVSKILDGMTETITGTSSYVAPEVYLGKTKYSMSADVYSLGMVLYCLFNYQRFPFVPDFPEDFDKSDMNKAFISRIRGKLPPMPIQAPTELGEIILKTLFPYNERISDVVELRKSLENLLSNLDEAEKRKIISHGADETYSMQEINAMPVEDVVEQIEEEDTRNNKKWIIWLSIILFICILIVTWFANDKFKNNDVIVESTTVALYETSTYEKTSETTTIEMTTEEKITEQSTTKAKETKEVTKKEKVSTSKYVEPTQKKEEANGKLDFELY